MLRARRHPRVRGRRGWRVAARALVVAAIFAAVIVAGRFPVTVIAPPPAPLLAAGSLSFPGLASAAPMTAVTSLEALPVPLTVVTPPVTEEEVLLAADGTREALTTLELAGRNAAQPLEAVSAREPAQIPIFYRYEVQEGDNLTLIAARFGIDKQFILWNNADVIDNADALSVGEMLQVPSVEGVIHAVRLGETLTEIVSQYDADVRDVIDFPGNGLSDPNLLREGSMVLVPGGRRLPRPAPSLRPELPGPLFVNRGPSAAGFIWPVVNNITSYFGPYHPLGVDINAPFVPVAASAAGQVVFVGGDACCSYGHYIEVDHGGSYSTLYAHLSSFNVALGQWVEQGQIIALSGNSGRSTGPHLHFELHRNGIVLNPLLFLP